MKLVPDGDRTIIDGWMGLHTSVASVGIIMMLTAALISLKGVPWFSAGVILLVAFGYFVESRELRDILTRCVNNETCEGSKRSSDEGTSSTGASLLDGSGHLPLRPSRRGSAPRIRPPYARRPACRGLDKMGVSSGW